jgi:tetratricopeptide (TPR) repeat protein
MTLFETRTMRLLGLSLALAVLAAPTPAAGQAGAALTTPQKTCDIDEAKPDEVGKAYLSLTTGASATSADARKKGLTTAVTRASQNAEKGTNPVARAEIIAKAFVFMMGDTTQKIVTTRGAVGLPTNPDAPIDLYLATDSLLHVVETLMPECAEEMRPYRLNQGWLNILNTAQELIQTGEPTKLDSAEKLVARSFIMNKTSPFPYQFLATIEQQRNHMDKSVEHWRKAIDVAGTDSSNNDLRRQAYYYLASILTQQAQLDTVRPRQVATAREAAKDFQQYLDEAPKDEDVAAIRYNRAAALTIAGDTAAVIASYADMIANPDKYTANDLFYAGNAASLINNAKDAGTLFEASLKTEPYNRDALFNVSYAYLVAGTFDKLLPVATRLLSIDPGNPDNVDILAQYFSAMYAKEADSVKKKVLSDSALKLMTLRDSMPLKVTMSTFSKQKTKTEIGGQVGNLSAATRSFQLQFEFLDNNGNAVANSSVTVGPIEPKAFKEFKVTVDVGQDAHVVAYRYKVMK